MLLWAACCQYAYVCMCECGKSNWQIGKVFFIIFFFYFALRQAPLKRVSAKINEQVFCFCSESYQQKAYTI